MSSYPLVKFTDAISGSVRLDLNDRAATASRGVEATIDLGVPAIEGDPDAVGQAFGFRTMSLTVQIKGTKANALAFVSALSKELQRRTNWLMFQLDASRSPVWFKTYRTGYQSLSLEQVFANSTTGGNAPAGYPDVCRVEVPLVAESHSYGPRQTLSALKIEQTIPTDLDATWNALTVALPALKGDAPTSLRVNLAPQFDLSVDEEWMVGCISGSSSMLDPAFDIGTGDGYTAGTGTSAGSSNAAYVGGTYRIVTIAANDGGAGTSVAKRLNGTVTTTLPQGRYKVLLRYEADITGSAKTYLFRWVTTNTANTVPTVPVTVAYHSTPETQQGWVDLGDIAFPRGVSELPADSGVLMPTTVSFEFWVGTSDNSAGTVRLDAFKFVPVTGTGITRSTIMKTRYLAAQTGYSFTTWDGDSETVWITNVTPRSPLDSSMEHKGSFLVADPASEQNLLVVVATKRNRLTANATGVNTSRKATSQATVSYYPRYLHIGDGT